jgi:hypothetical protein
MPKCSFGAENKPFCFQIPFFPDTAPDFNISDNPKMMNVYACKQQGFFIFFLKRTFNNNTYSIRFKLPIDYELAK